MRATGIKKDASYIVRYAFLSIVSVSAPQIFGVVFIVIFRVTSRLTTARLTFRVSAREDHPSRKDDIEPFLLILPSMR